MTCFLQRLVFAAVLGFGTTVQAHDLPPPATPAARVAVSGAVQQALSLSVDDLRQFPQDQIVELLLPARDATSQPSVLKGVRLRALLERAKVVAADHNTVKKLAIIAAATDGYKVVFSWSELFNAELGNSVLVVFERDGQPLAVAEGPLALISGKDIRTGPRHVKWLQSVEVRQIVD
ncbi:molybdopterin-dependent oxidoreductase [Duganella sp. CT11-25]|jgi:DMSO/TMAO reductase YedYZ molybdopterin-dependent catalytic subunit|uniref:molybdopterin-dependent oxidoreductase n=1 Tax=unclassified Duganella TaxID=2636909 RepID=UPI0039B07987